MLGGEDVRVGLQEIQRIVAVVFIHPHREDGAEAKGAHKLHQPPYARLTDKASGNLSRLGKADALDFRKLFRLVFDHVEAFRPEAVDDQRGRGRADALDRAARQILVDRGGVGRHEALGKLRLELPSVHGVRRPRAAQQHRLSLCGIGEAAHHGDRLPVAVAQAQHRIAVFFVFIDDRIDRSVQIGQHAVLIHFLHSFTGALSSEIVRYSSLRTARSPPACRQRPARRRRRRPRGRGR